MPNTKMPSSRCSRCVFHVRAPLSPQARPDLFTPNAPCYSLDSFHLQGSRILSRSFTIPVDADAGSDADSDDDAENTIAVLIPMADMLNAASERDNARLFDDAEHATTDFSSGFTMSTTKPVDSQTQIVSLITLILPLTQAVQYLCLAAKLRALAEIWPCRRLPPRTRATQPSGDRRMALWQPFRRSRTRWGPDPRGHGLQHE